MTRPNVIWIYCDELRIDAVGFCDHEHAPMHAPRINALAEDPNCLNIRARLAGRLKAHPAGAAEPPEAYVLREGGAGPQPREGEAT